MEYAMAHIVVPPPQPCAQRLEPRSLHPRPTHALVPFLSHLVPILFPPQVSRAPSPKAYSVDPAKTQVSVAGAGARATGRLVYYYICLVGVPRGGVSSGDDMR